MADEKKKPDLTHTLASFFPDDQEINTQVIDNAKQFAHRQLRQPQARPIINALDRLSKQRDDKKKKDSK